MGLETLFKVGNILMKCEICGDWSSAGMKGQNSGIWEKKNVGWNGLRQEVGLKNLDKELTRQLGVNFGHL